jgi:glycine cleavage system H lipoate-binding protein
VKLYNLPTPIVPLKQTRQDLGYTDAQIKLMEAEDALAQAQQAAQFEMATAAQDAAAPVDGQPADQASGDQTQQPG